ncbi:uncharacterized protein [Vicugna pacos]|uniref:Skin secretory protein xP2-like n=1 Tax=Vicugna pacos TaxID=30538 RepID=A0ABM5D7C9_VICPA
MFCCVPTPRGRGPRKARSEGLGQRCRRWVSSHPRRLWPFGHRDPKSRTLQEPLDEDTRAASPTEGPVHASQGQHQLRVSLHTEGSLPPRRRPPQKPPRRHARVPPAGDRQLSRPGSDLEHLPGSQVEDQEPTEAEPKVTDPEQAGAGEDARDQKQDHQDPAGDPELTPVAPAEPEVPAASEDPAAPADLAAPEDPAAPAAPAASEDPAAPADLAAPEDTVTPADLAAPKDPEAPADLAAPKDPAAPAPAPGPLGSGEPVQASSPPRAEPPLPPPTSSSPKSHHEFPPPPEFDFPTPEFVFVLFLFSLVCLFHIIYGILYYY